MSLIRVRPNSHSDWKNPFTGQQDPYIGLNSSISYDGNPEGTVINTYSLNGCLTGCSVSELTAARDALVKSFDWKENTGIIENIDIKGVVKATPERQILVSSLSFDSSNYIGALCYSMSLDVFTGFEGEEADNLYNKTHTVSTSIAEDGCVTINTTIGCEPNANMTECKAIEAANKWISGQLGVTKLGEITMTKQYNLLNESLDINPQSSALSYSRTESNCQNGQENTADGGLAGTHFAYCVDSSTNQGGCESSTQEVTLSYQGEVYDTGKSSAELLSEIKTRLFEDMKGITDFTATYDESQSNVTFSATKLTNGGGDPLSVPQDLTVNNYTLSTSTNYNDGGGAVTMGSVNGRVYIENPISKSPLDVNDEFDPETMIALAKGVCNGPSKLSQQNVSYDTIKGGINYSYGFTEADGPDGGIPNLEGVAGLVSWSVDYKPALRKYEMVPNLNCSDLIVDLGYADKGSISVTATAVSGSGLNPESIVSQKKEDLINTVLRNLTTINSNRQVEEDRIKTDGDTTAYFYKAAFDGWSVTSGAMYDISGIGMSGNEVGPLY